MASGTNEDLMAGGFKKKPSHSELLSVFYLPPPPFPIKTLHTSPVGSRDRKELVGTSCLILNSQGAENEKREQGQCQTLLPTNPLLTISTEGEQAEARHQSRSSRDLWAR